MNIAVSLEADRATLGMLTLDKLTSNARITGDAMTLEPISFGVLGGHYSGALVFTLGVVPDFKLDATLAGVDMGTATAFAGTPGVLTGRLSGNLHLAGHGMDASSVIKSARGTARVEILNGVIKNSGWFAALWSRRPVVPTAQAWGRREPEMSRSRSSEPH